jgi:signal transduction histidine kinase/CheY-like chemotaxis protein
VALDLALREREDERLCCRASGVESAGEARASAALWWHERRPYDWGGDLVPRRTQEALIELTTDLVVEHFDDAACAIYGVDVAAVRGRALCDVLLSDAGPIEWAQHWAAVRAGAPFERLMIHRSCAGLRVWVTARLEATPQGARLRARRASGRAVLEAQPGGVVAAISRMLEVGGVGLWMDDRITDEFDWSRQARALHDLSPDVEVTPALLFGRIHPDDRSQAAAEIQRGIAEKIPYDGVLRVKHGERDYRHLRVFGGASYDDEGVALLSVGGVVDISETVALRARIRELEDQLRVAQRGDVVGRLAGGVAHDFNNFLTGILGCCEMMALETLPETSREDIRQIRAATLRAAELTRQLLAFGRRQALRRRVLAPSQVLSDVLGLLRRTIAANIELQLQPVEVKARVLADDTQLHQVLTNLVVNAAQAMPGGGRVEIGASEVALSEGEVTGGEAGTYVRFAVEDSGPGVPEELRARIFEPFFSTKPAGHNSGLGLSVVQGIVEQHQGHIVLRDGTLGGARFEVYLPVTDQALGAGDVPVVVRSDVWASALRVLLVEDEKMVRELTKRILVGAGFTVSEAPDADSALRRAVDQEFDVLLTDIVLPGMSGPELVARLRQHGRTFRVVYMSGYPADFVDSRVQLEPNEVLVQKPFTAETLVTALRGGRNTTTQASDARGAVER